MKKFFLVRKGLSLLSMGTSFAFVLAILIVLPSFSSATILYENNFDDVPDWTSPPLQSISGLSTTHAEAESIGFTSYRATDTMGEPLFAINSANARGGSGKGLSVNVEVRGNWAGGGLDIHFADPEKCGGKLKADVNPAGYEELYIRFYQRFEPGWKWGGSGTRILKIFRAYTNVDYNCKLASGDLSSSKDCNGQGMTSYLIVDWQGTPNYVVAYREEPSTITQHKQDYNCSWADYFADGQWHCIEFHLKMNDVGENNTIADIYIDGVKRGQLNSPVALRKSQDKRFNTLILFDNHTIPPEGAPYEQKYYIDDLVISTEYIGPDYVIGQTNYADIQNKKIILVGASVGNYWDISKHFDGDHGGYPYLDISNIVAATWDKTSAINQAISQGADAIIVKECSSYFPRDLEQAKADYTGFIEQIKNAGRIPILATVVPVTVAGDKLGSLTQFNDWIRSYADQNHYALLDLEAALRISDTDRRLNAYYSWDGTHLYHDNDNWGNQDANVGYNNPRNAYTHKLDPLVIPTLVAAFNQDTDGNHKPVANAGGDQVIIGDGTGPVAVHLDGTASYDSDGSIVSYVWTESGQQLGTGSTLDLGLDEGIHRIILTVTDNDGATATDEVVITVTIQNEENSGVTAYWQADGDILSSSIGDPNVSIVGATEFVSGIQGNAFYVSSQSSWAEFEAEGNVPTAKGSIEFYLKPTWNHTDNVYHSLIQVGEGEQNEIKLWKAANNYLFYYLWDSSGNMRRVYLSPDQYAFNAEQWTAIKITWDDTSNNGCLGLYLNGQLKVKKDGDSWSNNRLNFTGKKFYVGGSPTDYSHPPSSAIDELIIKQGDTTPPSDISNFLATPGDGEVTLRWTNPTDSDFAGVMIRYRTDTWPVDYNDGQLVCNKTGKPDRSDSFVHTGLQNGITYYYSAFTYDTSGNYSQATHVSATPGTSGGQTNQPPTASISASPASGESPLTVSFSGTGSDSDGTIQSYSWDFGDGATSTSQNPTHTYARVSSETQYTVTLTVTDDDGATGQATTTITVSPDTTPPSPPSGVSVD